MSDHESEATYYEIGYFYRVLDPTEKLNERLILSCPKGLLEIKDRRDMAGKVALVSLIEDHDYEWLIEIAQTDSEWKAKAELYVSLVTESPSSGAQIPKFVSRLIQRAGGGIYFSFTVV